MRVLITGGFGYLGGRLAQHLAREVGDDVVLASRTRTVAPEWLPSAELVVARWESEAELSRICEGADAVLHLAGTNAADSGRDPANALEVNGGATSRLAAAAAKSGVAKFVYFSTAHVYARPLRGRITEDTPPSPAHPYATSHLAGEDAAREIGGKSKMDAIVIRLSNAYGAPAHKGADCWTLLVNDLARQAVTSRQMQLWGTGLERRDFIPIADMSRAVEHLLRLPAPLAGASLFNLGGGWSPTVWEMANLVRQRCGVVLGFTPQLTRAEARPDEEPVALDYRIDKLSRTGFQMGSDRTTEIDEHLECCREWFGGVDST